MQTRKEKATRQQCARFTMFNNVQCAKFITKEQTQYVLREIYKGACRNHLSGRTMAAKVLKAGYYWPTVQNHCAEYVKKCTECQEFGPLSQRPLCLSRVSEANQRSRVR